MKNSIPYYLITGMAACFLLLLAGTGASAQQVQALPADGSASQESSPQGGLRFQRQFFLITPAEMAENELQNGMTINSIGFTLAGAQNNTTQGNLSVYLQNTQDSVCRIDTSWTALTSATNAFTSTDLNLGDYQWQVQTVCGSDTSAFSEIKSFSTTNPFDCNRPENLSTQNVTESSATFVWSSPFSSGFTNYVVEYRITGDENWIQETTTGTTFTATGLVTDTSYQWRVKTVCSGDDSPTTGASFDTRAPVACDAPSGLTNRQVTDTSATLAWTAAAEASYYAIQYRRSGTSAWLFTISLTDSVTIDGLNAGTSFEWRIRTVCSDGNGAYVDGTPFTTSGPTACYPPTSLTVNVLTDTSAAFSWMDTGSADSYIIRYRLKESISWDNATSPMTLVHNDEFTIPDTIGPYTVTFAGTGTNPFTYTGNGLYIAWEYTNESGALSSENTSLATTRNTVIRGAAGQDSVNLILSLASVNDRNATGHRPVLSATRLRPETRLGSTALGDSVEVSAVYTLGRTAIPFGNPQIISARIKNHTSSELTLPATLTVVSHDNGEQRFSATENVTVDANASAVVTFPGWAPSETGTDSIIVAVPALGSENVLANNRNFSLQVVNNSVISYEDDSDQVTSTGFDNGEGLILSRFTMNGCGTVNAAVVFLDFSARDHPLYAVVLDASGTIVDSSAVFTPDSTQVDNYYSFFFPDTPFFTQSDYYIGLAQPADPGDGYFPVGVQYETENIRDSAYYRANLNGTGLTHTPAPGRLMIRSEVVAGNPLPVIEGDLSLCPGESTTLGVASREERFANEVIDYSTRFSNVEFGARQALGTPDVYPQHGTSPRQWVGESADGQREYLELSFANPGPVNFIDIYETLNPGAVDTAYVKNPATGNYEVVYADSAFAAPKEARVNRITFPLTAFDVDEIRLAINSPQVAGFNGIDAVAIGQELSPPGFTSYLWSTGEATPSIEVSAAGTYSVNTTDAGGCIATTSEEVSVSEPVIPEISIGEGQPATLCEGDSVTLISSQPFGNTWSTGDTTMAITVTSAGIYLVTFDDGSGCGTTTSDPVEVTVNPLPAVSISGQPGICPGSSTTLDAGPGYDSYQWSSGETTQNIQVNAAGTFTVTVTDGNGCSNTASLTTFTVSPPAPEISGQLSFCQDEQTTLDAGAGYTSYSWSNGATTQTIIVDQAATYSVTVTDASGCSGSTSVTTSVLTPPTPEITGDTAFCPGSSSILATSDSYASYSWSNGETTPSIIITETGTYSLTVTDANGCTGTASVTTTHDGTLPETPGPITGPALGLCSLTGLQYSIDPVPNTTHYVWTVPEGVIIVSGQGSTSITVNVTSSFSSGNIIVKASNFCGQSPTFGQRFLTAQGYPQMPDTPSGPATVVCGQGTYSYSIPPVPGATFYEWLLPDGATIVSGLGTTSVSVAFDASFSSGEICVNAINECGISLCCSSNCLTVSCEENNLLPPASEPAAVAENQENDPGGSSDLANKNMREVSGITQGLNFAVYPNPNSGRFNLQTNLTAPGRLEIKAFTLTGQMVFHHVAGYRDKGFLLEEIDIPGLSAGAYLLKVSVDETVWHTKIVIQ